ncbi:MAG: hypothetical protein M3N28_10360 [Actinomycetota bacterium]|nr:hypothetical protein [Actinomycetota bacterium]
MTEDNDNDGVPNNVVDSSDNRHPSGKDRSVEKGGSGNQDKSGSDPDGNKNGGADKPGGAGGVDKHDQDGNNGCGNDDDFEDDNNGNCGGRRGPKVKGSGNQGPGNQGPGNQGPGNQAGGPGGTSPGTTTPTGDAPVTPPAAVLGIEVSRPATVAPLTSFPGSDVLGVGLSRLSDPAASLSDPITLADASGQSRTSGSLPRTGSGASDLAQLAMILLGAGGTLMATSRRRPTAATRA